jgi:hypothetical protein
MLNKRITAPLIAIAIASLLMAASGGFAGSAYAFAAKKGKEHENGANTAIPFSGFPILSAEEDKPISRTSHSNNAGDSDLTVGEVSGMSSEKIDMWKKECNT